MIQVTSGGKDLTKTYSGDESAPLIYGFGIKGNLAHSHWIYCTVQYDNHCLSVDSIFCKIEKPKDTEHTVGPEYEY